MKFKLLLLTLILAVSWIVYSGFSGGDDDPRWNQDPRTAVNLSGDYKPLPVVYSEIKQFTTEPRTTITPIGVMVTYPNVRVHPSATNDYSQSEVPIVSSPVNRNILFASSNAYVFSTGLINSGVYVSLDGGVTWTGTETLPGAGTNDQRGDPGPMIDKNGVFLFTHLTSTTNFGAVTGMGANRSINNGATWSTTVQVSADANADKNLGTTDDSPLSPYYGQSYFAWTSFSTSPANGRTSRTLNSGVTWSAPLVVNTTPAGHNAQGHDMAVGPNGDVYITWTAGVSSSPFTEDFVGFAKSVNGGASYTANENIFDDNGSRSSSYNGWGIRTNGFPRIAVDKTGGVRNGWIYIVVSQVNLAPAGTDADVVLHRSSDGGVTWSGGIRVNQDALNNGKVQFFPAVCVDSDGGVDVVYYDNRNFPSVGDSCSVYISRSLDGGTTWGDVKIADHNFKPKQMSPFGGGYMGDYIGITQSIGKVVAVWMDDKAAPVGSNKPSCWAGALDISKSTICQDFSSATFPPSDMLLEFTGTQYWTRQTPSAYASGTGSAKFDFWTASAGVTQSLVTYKFAATAAGTYLTFDRSYSPWFTNRDSLIIEVSNNGGTTYTNLARLWGDEVGGAPLNTVARISNFTPTSGGQWAPMNFALPAGTDKIRFKAVSGFGNNLYLDNICLQSLATPVANTLCAMPEGFYRPSPPSVIPDTIRVYLYRTDFPKVAVDSVVKVLTTFGCLTGGATFTNALSGNYYLGFKHRNTMKTFSTAGGFVYTRGASFTLDLINNLAGTYLNSEKAISGSPYYGLYGGDINQDEIIDGSDLSLVDNAALSALSGYVKEDVTGDNFADADDISIVDNNQGVVMVGPPGAEPTINPNEYDQTPEFKTEAERQKYETGLRANLINQEILFKQKQERDLLNEKYNFKNRIPSKGAAENIKKYDPNSITGLGCQ